MSLTAVKPKEEKNTRIFFLFEHKSYPDRNVLLQVLYYQAAHYWKQVRENQPPELMIPIIFVHGQRKFRVTPLVEIFGLQETVFAPYLPTFTHELINVNGLSSTTLDRIRATYLISMMLAFKGNGNKEQLLINIAEIFKFVQAHNNEQLEKAFMTALVEYLVGIYNLKQADMNDIQTQIPKLATPAFKAMGFNIWHEGREEGILLGKQEGLREGIEKGKRIKDISKDLEFVISLLCEAPNLTDATRANLANVKSEFITTVRKTFTRRAIKKRKADFRLFYQRIEGLNEEDYHEIDQLFERLRKKIKSAKIKLTAKETKKK